MLAEKPDLIVVGAGLAGLVAAAEAAAAGRTVLVLDQKGEQNTLADKPSGRSAVFFVDSPEQRRRRIGDSRELAFRDRMNTACIDRPEHHWPRRWAGAYIECAIREKRSWWAEHGAAGASAPGALTFAFGIACSTAR